MINSMQDQYKGTNIEAVLENVAAVFDKHLRQPVTEFHDLLYRLDTAVGVGLDTWGVFLRFPRYIGERGTANYQRLEDDQYRVILKVLALQTKTKPTIQDINKHMALVFGVFGADAYVLDPQNMTFITYVFNFRIPEWLRFVFANYDILPRPMGVGVKVAEGDYTYLGFEGQELSNFYNSIFEE